MKILNISTFPYLWSICLLSLLFFQTANANPIAIAPCELITVSDESICENLVVDLADYVTDNGTAVGPITYYTSSADANAETNPLGGGLVNPSAMTTYWVRKNDDTDATCYDIKSITLTIIFRPELVVKDTAFCPTGASIDLADLIVSTTFTGTFNYYTVSPFGLLSSSIVNPTSTESYYIHAPGPTPALAYSCSGFDIVTIYIDPEPTATAAGFNVTCTSDMDNGNGTIKVSGHTQRERYDYTPGTTYTGTATYHTATDIPINGVLTNTLSNPSGTTDYTIRIFNGGGCTVDRTVSLSEVLCCSATNFVQPTITINDN